MQNLFLLARYNHDLCPSASMLSSLFDILLQIRVIANFRGHRQNITGTTVEDICQEVSKSTGVSPSEQTILFKGKILSKADKLSKAGVSVGDTINIMRKRKEMLTGSRPVEDSGMCLLP